MRDEKDPLAVRILFVIPGFIFLTGTNIFGGVMRLFGGLVEVPPGAMSSKKEATPPVSSASQSEGFSDSSARNRSTLAMISSV